MQPNPSYTLVGGSSIHRTGTPYHTGSVYRVLLDDPQKLHAPRTTLPDLIYRSGMTSNPHRWTRTGCRCSRGYTRAPLGNVFCLGTDFPHSESGLACSESGNPRPGYRGYCCRDRRLGGEHQAFPQGRGRGMPRRPGGAGRKSASRRSETYQSECTGPTSSVCSRSNHLQEPYANDPPKRLQFPRPTTVRDSRFRPYPKCSTGGVYFSTNDPRMT